MANMRYCRFENTLRDVKECYEHMEDSDLSDNEQYARRKLIKECRDLAADFEHELED